MGWEKVKFRGMDCLAFEGRPESENARYPRQDYHYYPMRHGESDWACPITIERYVLVNFWGMIGTPKPLRFSKGCGYLNLRRNDAERFAERSQV
jgi:hypothetical protein